MDANQVPLIKQVALVAAEKVPEQDFQQQVDRWNRYQEGLDRIERQCRIENVRFRRRLTTSYSERRIRNITRLAGLMFLIASTYTLGFGISIAHSFEVNGYAYIFATPTEIASMGLLMGFLVTLGLGMHVINSGKLPEKIRFHCAPVINIDDLYYLQRFVIGMQRERHDPKVVLPELTMELPQSWIQQQSLLKVMETMKDIRL